MPGVARDDGLLEIDGVLEQPLDDEEEPLDGADEGGREGEVLGLVVKELLGSRAYLAQRSAAAHLPQAVHFKGCSKPFSRPISHAQRHVTRKCPTAPRRSRALRARIGGASDLFSLR